MCVHACVRACVRAIKPTMPPSPAGSDSGFHGIMAGMAGRPGSEFFRPGVTGRAAAQHLETHTRSQTPHFMSYPMDMIWILQHQVYFLAKCHIHVISMSYLFFKKDIFGYTWYILNEKNCIWYIPGISFHVICHAYPCPIHVISLSGCLAPEIQQEIALWFEFCIPRHSVHQAQQDLFATATRADSSFASCLGWGRRRGGLLRAGGPSRRRGRLVAGSAGGGSAGVWGFLGVRDSGRALGAGTLLAPVMPSTPS